MKFHRKFTKYYFLIGILGLLIFNLITLFYPRPKINLPVDPSELDYSGNNYLIWPFGVRGGGHPEGHPGIDFSWNWSGHIYAVIKSIVTMIRQNDHGTLDVYTIPIGYPFVTIQYGEVVNLSEKVKVGNILEEGDLIGHPQKIGDNSYMFHFGIDRFYCIFFETAESPEYYFNDEAIKIIGRSIWDNGTLMNLSSYTERNESPYLTNLPLPFEFYIHNAPESFFIGPIVIGIFVGVYFISNYIIMRNKPDKK